MNFCPQGQILSVQGQTSKVPKTALMTFNIHSIHMIGRRGQGRQTLMSDDGVEPELCVKHDAMESVLQ